MDAALQSGAVAVLLSITLGFAISDSRLGLFVLPFAAAGTWLFVTRPLIGLAVVVLGASSFALVGAWPTVSTPLGTTSIVDFLFLAALIAGVSISVQAPDIRLSAEGSCLALLIAATLLGALVGVSNGADPHDVELAVREMGYYGAFWIARPLLSRPGRWLVLATLAAIAVAVVGIQLAQVIIGPSPTLFLVGSDSQIVNVQSDADAFLRVRPPGLTLVYIVSAFAAAYLISGPPKHRRTAALLLLVTVVGIALSLNRNMLLGLVAGLCVAALISANSARVIAVLASAGVILLGTGAVLSTTGTGGNALLDRIVSIGDRSQLDTGTLADRSYENRLAMNEIKREPLTGIGWGASYGATVQVSGITQDRRYIHNQYLGIWLRAGLLGLAAILAAVLFAFRNGTRAARARGPDAWLGTGVVISMVAMAVSSAVGIYMMEANSIVPLAVTLALAASLGAPRLKEDYRDGQPREGYPG